MTINTLSELSYSFPHMEGSALAHHQVYNFLSTAVSIKIGCKPFPIGKQKRCPLIIACVISYA